MGQSHRVVGLADRVLLDRTLVYRTSFQSLLSLAKLGVPTWFSVASMPA